MASAKKAVAGRARWLAFFTLFLLAVTAVPVLADPPPADVPLVSPAEAESLPDGPDLIKALQEAKEREAEEQQARETTAAEQERAASQDVYSGASATEAESLLRTLFAEQFALLEQDPARMLSDAQLEKVLSPTDARVRFEGNTVLLDGTTPVQAPDEDGELSKVDLDLVATAGGYAPINPLSELNLPTSSSGATRVGDEGLAIEPVITEPASTAHLLEGEDLLYPETQTDTDLLASPLASGVELFSQLRSAESPEELRFELTLPPGAELRADGEGGAEVIDDEQLLARIPAPTALDAQGADVPVQMRVESNELALEVAHRSMDLAYPLLVDPAIVDEWYTGAKSWYAGGSLAALSDGTWGYSSSDWGRFVPGTSPVYATFGGSNRGLFVSAKNIAENQWSGRYGQWSYTVPGGTTYIELAGISPLWRNDHGCSSGSYPEPHDYVGLWSPAWSPGWGWMSFQSNPAIAYGYAIATPPNDWRKITAQQLIIGLGTGTSNSPPIPCWRDLYAGGAYVWMNDVEAPTLGQVTGVPSGSKWVSNDASLSLGVSASDPGLGVQNILLNNSSGGKAPLVIKNECDGTRANSCPPSMSGPIEVTAGLFKEGKRPVSVVAKDPTGKTSSYVEWYMHVDNTAPTIDLDGQLAEATEEDEGAKQGGEKTETLRLPVYNLEIKAKDGSNEKPEDMRSGVKSIAVYLDGKQQPEKEWVKASCPESSCAMTQTFTLQLVGLSAGEHTLRVVAKDQLERAQERPIEFSYFPATGMKDEYVMHYFPLPDGKGSEDEEEHPSRPELAVNVINGNLVYREQDVDVEGYGIDLEVERYYNSQLPASEDTEWGHGWTLAQTPALSLEESGAAMLDASGALENEVDLPDEIGSEIFDPVLQAAIVREADGYELTDETGETSTSIAFDETGRIEELRTDGYAKIDYSYEGEALSEIAVKDPASTSLLPQEVEESVEPVEPTPIYSSAFGSVGAGNGQLKKPADVAIDSAGNALILDKANNRIQKFNEEGEYLSKFGSAGLGNGQFLSPVSLAIDAKGNVWVSDEAFGRIQKFNDKGEYLSKFGSKGTGAGQFGSSGPGGIAIDAKGNIWVSDTSNGRVLKFNEAGQFIEVVGSKGSGTGQLGEPAGIDVGPDGRIWVADRQNNRTAVFDEAGEFIFQFGASGAGDGEFNRPDAIDVDAQGNVWVGDQDNARVQRFDQAGKYIAQFGSQGSGQAQFNFAHPMGIATDDKGSLWVTDVNNNRIQRWSALELAKEVRDDPAVEINSSGGLVSSLEGDEAGEHSYGHEGSLLTSHEGPDGETSYEYDSAKRLTRVDLPNGTWAEIEYDSASRVAVVEVDPAGSDPATEATFFYDDANRRTTVHAPPNPTIRYEYSNEDGSVFKSSDVAQAPKLEDLGGSLYVNKEKLGALASGDHNFFVTAQSFEGVKSIMLIANGSELIDEETCEEDFKTSEVECPQETLGWTTYTGNLAPGILYLEAVVTDHKGGSASERFWVDIPRTPPPPPGGAVEPHFPETLQFREDHGLDLDLEDDENAVEDRVNLTLYNWVNGDPVARASMERWGAPLLPKDVAELEYRIAYQRQAATAIPAWVQANAASSYAGYYIDERAGGLIRVGFTGDQAGYISTLKQGAGLMAPDRVVGFSIAPQYSFSTLNALEEQVIAVAQLSFPGVFNRISVDIAGNLVWVGSSDVPQAKGLLQEKFGINSPIVVDYAPALEPSAGRERITGPMLAGDRIYLKEPNEEMWECSAGYGAFERATKPATGAQIWRMFLLAAAHCAPPTSSVIRQTKPYPQPKERIKIGTVKRTGWQFAAGSWDLDVEAIRFEGVSGVEPRRVFPGPESPAIDVKAVGLVEPGMRVCFSGATTDEKEYSGVKCGKVVFKSPEAVYFHAHNMREWCFDSGNRQGDSGSPIWQEGTNIAVGILSSGGDGLTCFAPLLVHPEFPDTPGALNDMRLGPLGLALQP